MTPGRPLEYDPAVALAATMRTFWQQGYDGTSLSDLLAATRLSKSSFYQAFGSKHAAFCRAFRHYCDELRARLERELAEAGSAWSFLDGVLRAAAAEARASDDPRGCMIVNVATEFSGRDPAVRALVATGMDEVCAVFARAIRRAQREGSIPAGAGAQVLARYLLAGLAGVRALVKAGAGQRSVDKVVDVVLRGLSAPPAGAVGH